MKVLKNLIIALDENGGFRAFCVNLLLFMVCVLIWVKVPIFYETLRLGSKDLSFALFAGKLLLISLTGTSAIFTAGGILYAVVKLLGKIWKALLMWARGD